MTTTVGFTAEEIDTAAPTRAARLKWVVVVNGTLPAGLATNAAVCAAAATAPHIAGLLGADAIDASGAAHPGLPWAGCSVLQASGEELSAIRRRAAAADGTVYVADMPAAAQLTRVYDDYLETMARTQTADVEYFAVSIVGPRNRVDRIVGRLPLL